MKPFLMTDEKKKRYTNMGYWGLPTLHEVFEMQSTKYPDKEFLIDSNSRLTFSQIKQYADRFALGLLEMGYRKDDVLVIHLPNIIESAILRVAAPKAGVLASMVMIAFEEKELIYILQKTGAKGIVIPWRFGDRNIFETVQSIRSELPQLENIFVAGDNVPEEAISINYMLKNPLEEKYATDFIKDKGITTWDIQELQTTTGSTGTPKISEGFGWYQLMGHTIGERLKATEKDIIAFFVPYIGGPGNCLWCVGLINACKMIFSERFDPETALSLIDREKVTIAVGVPTVGEKLIRCPSLNKYDLNSIRIFFTAGAPMPPSLALDIEKKMSCKVIGIIGSMDFGPISLTSVDDPPDVRIYSLGKPLQGIEIKIVDKNGNDVPEGKVGELICKGPYAYTGYFKMPDVTLEAYGGEMDGWFKTQDLARLDKDGNLYIVDRIQDIIKRGAMTIAPVEIEDLLRTYPNVEDVAVVPMPDSVLGERVCAFVILKKESTLHFEEMISFLQKRGLAKFKMPERLEIVDCFPIKGEQKVFKKKLVEIITDKLRAEGQI